jgi:hypothetical protein
MACGVPFEEFIKLLGHDGSEQRWPDAPGKPVGFHIQECINVALLVGLSCTPVEFVPLMRRTPSSKINVSIYSDTSDEAIYQRCFTNLRRYSNSVLEVYVTHEDGQVLGHAVACDGEYIHDPRGSIYPICDLKQRNYVPLKLWIIGGMGE